MAEKVVILGGGVAGLSAAFELIERGFEVEVYERQMIAGGKARSIPVMINMDDRGAKDTHIKALERFIDLDGPNLPPDAERPWLPGEHGFRFFPNFYRHITHTMERIPFYDTGETVADQLVDTSQVLISQYGKAGIVTPERFPHNLMELTYLLKTFLYGISPRSAIPFEEIEHFAACIWRIMTSCKERRFIEYEQIGWWDFIGAEERSEAYQKFLAIGITRSLVAAKARTASTKTIGDIFLQLLFGIIAPYPTGNRLLNAPTNVAWIRPWLKLLREKGVKYHLDSRVTAINCSEGRIQSATIEQDGKTKQVTGDWFIGALPVERMVPLITPEMTRLDPALKSLAPLSNNVQWMNGIQYYLTRDVPLADGHVILIDSTWALTAVSQRQFWHPVDFEKWGNGKTKGLLSIDISQWNKPGLNGKTAMECTREEIAMEVWEQLKLAFNVDGNDWIRDEDMHYWFLDPDIVNDPNDPGRKENVEPLLVNRINTWRLRPNAGTEIPNFMLASDYVRTHTDLATMEGANEAARRAVNCILDRSGSDQPHCKIWDLHEPDALAPLRKYDEARYQAGLPWDDRFAVLAEASLKVAQDATGIREGGDGPLAAIAPFASEFSKPGGGGIQEQPLKGLLENTGVPKEVVAEVARNTPGLIAPAPGQDLLDVFGAAMALPAVALHTPNLSEFGVPEHPGAPGTRAPDLPGLVQLAQQASGQSRGSRLQVRQKG